MEETRNVGFQDMQVDGNGAAVGDGVGAWFGYECAKNGLPYRLVEKGVFVLNEGFGHLEGRISMKLLLRQGETYQWPDVSHQECFFEVGLVIIWSSHLYQTSCSCSMSHPSNFPGWIQ